jgi:L-asparagine transporter-like permease
VILLTHLKFRKAVGPERVALLPLRLRWHPLPTLLGIAALLAITISTFFVAGLQYTVPAFVPFLLLISLAYWRMRRTEAARIETAKETVPVTAGCSRRD